MAGGPLAQVVQQLRRLAGAATASDPGDRDLLARFGADSDETAFGDLVQRHGPLVLGVCRRVLQHDQDAEDAFQATFLVLARKAGTLRNQEALAAWLYRVAFHLALAARARRSRRLSKEREAATMNPTTTTSEMPEPILANVLDEELNRLPAKYRTSLVLCYLQGKTNQEAARVLGWPAGSMSRHLARARELLRERLSRRGLVVGAVGTVPMLPGSGVAAVPAALQTNTVRAGLLFATGSTVALPAAPVALARDMLASFVRAQVQRAALIFLVLGTALLGGVLAHRALAQPQTPTHSGLTVAEEPPIERPAVAPKPRPAVVQLAHGTIVRRIAVSPDGKLVASAGNAAGAGKDSTVRLWELATGKEVRTFSGFTNPLTFTPDSKTLVGCLADQNEMVFWDTATGAEVRRVTHGLGWHLTGAAFLAGDKYLATSTYNKRGDAQTLFLWDLTTGKRVPLPEHMVGVWSLAAAPDGQRVVIGCKGGGIHVWDAAGARGLSLAQPSDALSVAFAPDGKTLASGGEGTVYLWELATGKERGRFAATKSFIWTLAFSPDGRVLALAGHEDPAIRLWELASGKERGRLSGHKKTVWSLTYAPDGQSLVSGGDDGTVCIWNLADGPAAPPADSTTKALDGLWNDLASTDATVAYQAINALCSASRPAITFLQGRLKPAAVPEAQRLRQLIADLNGPQFAARQQASEELERLGDLAAPALQEALANRPSLEVRQRIEQLLQKLQAPETRPERLQALRAIEALERIGTTECGQLLRTLAGGAPGARQTNDARASLERLTRRLAATR